MMKQSILDEKDKRIIREMNSIDWDFTSKGYLSPTEVLPFNCRKHHWYPGTFIPEIPFSLIEILSEKGSTILDPFAGIGTTYFQAVILGRKPIGIESCEIAHRFSQDLMYLIMNNQELIKVAEELVDINWGYREEFDYMQMVEGEKFKEIFPDWFARKTLNELCYLKYRVSESNEKICKAAFSIAISNMLMKCSSQNNGWGFIADSVKPKELKEKRVFSFFNSNVNLLLKDVQRIIKSIDLVYLKELSINDSLIKSNSLKLDILLENSIDAIITSPPYPNMIDYSQSQKLSYFFWDIPIDADISNEIGSRRNRNQPNAIENYRESMFEINTNLMSKLKKDAYLCYVLPYYEDNSSRREVMECVKADVTNKGGHKVTSIIRNLPVQRRANNRKWASLGSEEIIIWKKVR